MSAALRLSAQVENATIVAIICDRADRYLSTGEGLLRACGESLPVEPPPLPASVNVTQTLRLACTASAGS